MRVELFGDEVESLRWFSTFTQRSLADAERDRDRAGGGARPRPTASWRSWPRARRASARTSPRCCRSTASARSSSWSRSEAAVVLAAEEELRPGARRPLAGRHHEPALRRRPPPLPAARGGRRRSSSGRAAVQLLGRLAGPAAQLPRAGRRHRRAHDPGGRAGAREAGARRLPDGGRLGAPRRGGARRLQPRPAATRARLDEPERRRDSDGRRRAVVRAARAARGLHRAAAAGSR